MDSCPTCGSHELREVELTAAGDFRSDVAGVVPGPGDTIVACGVCDDFTVKPAQSSASSRPKRKAKPKPKAKAKAKPKSKGSRVKRAADRVRGRGTSRARRGTS